MMADMSLAPPPSAALLAQLSQYTPAEGNYYSCGLEKEALRVTPENTVATTPHPASLGAALTHPHITTDFSEALIELITAPLNDIPALLNQLRDLHVAVYQAIGNERLWASSMPGYLRGGRDIPLARYGTSNAGLMKTIYRRGLANRYGRVMQAIAGIHVNFSLAPSVWPLLQQAWGDENELAAFRDARYMAMVRTLQRLGWLVPYLFGASPAVDRSFLQRAHTTLQPLPVDAATYYLPYATSLRMGDIGYQNRQEEGTGIKACYDSLDAYIRSLTWAIQTPCPHYEHIGVKVGERYEQLNDHVLQIENEYYSTVRPKQLTEWMERPTLALRRRGIRYIELRSVDVNLFHPLGIDPQQLYFLVTLLCYSVLVEGPRINAQERRAIDANELLTAHQGREPQLRLEAQGRAVLLTEWARAVLDALLPVATWLDQLQSTPVHYASVQAQYAKLTDPAATPAAQLLTLMQQRREGFIACAQQFTEQHQAFFQQHTLDAARAEWLQQLAATSWQRQQHIEQADTMPFEQFLAWYYAHNDIVPNA